MHRRKKVTTMFIRTTQPNTMTRSANADRRKKPVSQKRGAAVVELAVLLPVLLTVTFGSLEICNRLFLRQTAAVAAYESARLAARRTVSVAQVQQRGMALLTGRRITGGQVIVTPAGNGLTTLPTGGELRVEVIIPTQGNTPVSYVLPVNGTVRATAVMLRE